MKPENDSNVLRMVDRACQILDYIYRLEGPASISTLSKDLDLPKANVFRILYTMQINGIIEKAPDSDLYRLGTRLVQYGEKVRQDFNLIDVCKGPMRELAKNIGESVNLGIIHEGNIVTLHSEEGESSVLVSKLIPVSEPHCSSMGKIYLAELADNDLKEYFTADLIQRTVNTITTLEEFERERANILEDGLSFDNEEYEYGLSCIAAPLKNDNNETIAMVSVSGPTSRLEYKGYNSIVKQLKETAYKLTDILMSSPIG